MNEEAVRRAVGAGSTIAIVPVIAVYVLGQRHFVSGLTAGAVKD